MMVCTLVMVDSLPAQNFRKFQKNGKWGILDKHQRVIIPIKYDKIHHYYTGFLVTLNKKCGFINNVGKEVLPVQYQKINEYPNKLMTVKKAGKFALFTNQGKALTAYLYDQMISDNQQKLFRVTIKGEGKNKKTGFINYQGKIVIPIKYDEMGFFYDYPNVNARIGKHHGILNPQGKVVVPFKYDYAYHLGKKLILLRKGKKKGVVTQQGVTVLPVKYHKVNSLLLFNKLIAAGTGNKTGLFDMQGKQVLPIKYSKIEAAKTLIRLTSPEGKTGLADSLGKLLIAPQYDHINPYYLSNGLMPARRDDKWGYVNTEGKETVKCTYESCGQFRRGIAIVKLKGKWGAINTQNTLVIPCEYDYITSSDIDRSPQYILAQKDKKYGMLNLKGETTISFVYESYIHQYNATQPLFLTTLEGKKGMLDGKENIVVPFEYDEVKLWRNTYRLRKNKVWSWLHTESDYQSENVYKSLKSLNNDVMMAQNKAGRYGLFDVFSGKQLSPFKYEQMGYLFYQSELGDYINWAYLAYGLIPARLNGKWGIINAAGKVIYPFELDKVYDFEGNKARVVKGKNTGYMDKTGKIVFAK